MGIAPPVTDGAGAPWVIVPGAPGADAPFAATTVGGKAHHLWRLSSVVETLPWIVIPADVFDRLVLQGAPWPKGDAETERRVKETLSLPLPEEFCSAVLRALDGTGSASATVAVRSSATIEDSQASSHAGRFESILGVPVEEHGEDLFDALRAVWASAFRPSPTGDGSGNTPEPRMAVILQQLVDAAASGVVFSVEPTTGARDMAVVSAVYGLGEGLMMGEPADTYLVHFCGDRVTAVEAQPVDKERELRAAPGRGTLWRPVPEPLRTVPVLSNEEARQVAAASRRLEELFGCPQDVEWAIVGDGARRRLLILQSRPITTLLPDGAEGDRERHLWDNSNIVESYSGVTTPLTFSFARSAYESVYLQFCRVMGVSETLLETHRTLFAGMIGLVRGRIYYDLLNWYRALSLLPGYSLNRPFMERMMGVRETLEDPPSPPYRAGRAADVVRLLQMCLKLLREHRRLPQEITAFHSLIEKTVGPLSRELLTDWPASALLDLHRRLTRDLLDQWRAPIVNDFFAMIAFGLLARLVERWLPGEPPTLVNDLIAGECGMISTEPARQVAALADHARRSPVVSAAFTGAPDEAALWSELQSLPEAEPFRQGLDRYLARFGDRCTDELKLETEPLGENPAFLLRTIRCYMARGADQDDSTNHTARQVREAAERRVREHLIGLRSAVFMRVLRVARVRIRDRENLRFERTRVFGLVRRLFLAMGARLAEAGALRSPRDVFFLTQSEVLAALAGEGAVDLPRLIAARRREFERYRAEPPPPSRFESVGPPRAPRASEYPHLVGSTGSRLKGLGCSAGVVRAPVRIVRDPRREGGLGGHILVAERTDPGWTVLFPLAVGLLVERGSLLSHSATVAREMGLPCIVSVHGLTHGLQDGEMVEMDGTAGTVIRLPSPVTGQAES